MVMEERRQNEFYEEASAKYGAAVERLARAYEADAEARRDLLQEIHIALWRSFKGFDARCSLRTWVYRVAHNAAATLPQSIRSSASKASPASKYSEPNRDRSDCNAADQ